MRIGSLRRRTRVFRYLPDSISLGQSRKSEVLGNHTISPLFPEFQPALMNQQSVNPALVIVILWGIAIATTTYLFMGSPHIVYGIVIQGVCMIGSAVYIRNLVTCTSSPANTLISSFTKPK